MLRAERKRKDSTYGDLIEKHIRDGTIVPVEITCKLLENVSLILTFNVFYFKGNGCSPQYNWIFS